MHGRGIPQYASVAVADCNVSLRLVYDSVSLYRRDEIQHYADNAATTINIEKSREQLQPSSTVQRRDNLDLYGTIRTAEQFEQMRSNEI